MDYKVEREIPIEGGEEGTETVIVTDAYAAFKDAVTKDGTLTADEVKARADAAQALLDGVQKLEKKVASVRLHAEAAPRALAGTLAAIAQPGAVPLPPLPTVLEPADPLGLVAPAEEAPRRWSLWKMICPVSLYDQKLVP